MWRLAVFAAWGPVHRRFDTLARPSAAKWLWVGGVAAVAFRAAAYLDRKVFGNRAAPHRTSKPVKPAGFRRERLCQDFCVNDQVLFLGMGCRGRGQFPFPGPSL